MQWFLVDKPITIAGVQYRPGDVVALEGTRGALFVKSGFVTHLPNDRPAPLTRAS